MATLSTVFQRRQQHRLTFRGHTGEAHLPKQGQAGGCNQTALNGGVEDDSGGEEDAEERAEKVAMEAEIGGVEISWKWSKGAFRRLDEVIHRSGD